MVYRCSNDALVFAISKAETEPRNRAIPRKNSTRFTDQVADYLFLRYFGRAAKLWRRWAFAPCSTWPARPSLPSERCCVSQKSRLPCGGSVLPVAVLLPPACRCSPMANLHARASTPSVCQLCDTCDSSRASQGLTGADTGCTSQMLLGSRNRRQSAKTG